MMEGLPVISSDTILRGCEEDFWTTFFWCDKNVSKSRCWCPRPEIHHLVFNFQCSPAKYIAEKQRLDNLFL